MLYKNIITSLMLGFGVALMTLSPVAEANPAAVAKAIFKGSKIVSKAKPVKIKIPTGGSRSVSRAVPSSGGSYLLPAAGRAVYEQNRREREQRAQKRSSWGW